jgi:uncharacterized RmlC-like cupin family protein
MNRREFVRFAAAAPLVIPAAESGGLPTGKPLVVLPGGARVYDIGAGGEARILAGAEQTNGAWWLGNLLSAPGRKTSLHVHFSADEQFYVLDGTLSMWVGGHWQELPVGAMAAMPRGIPHALGNRTKQPVRFLASGDPAGFERFFADIETTAHHFSYASPEFLAELAKVYRKYDSELLGPPPIG